MHTFGSHLSCGLQEMKGFSVEVTSNGNAGIKHRVDAIKVGRGAAMGLISLNRRQLEVWDKHLVDLGFKKVGRTVRNPNSGNDIRLYFLQRDAKTSKKKETKKKAKAAAPAFHVLVDHIE